VPEIPHDPTDLLLAPLAIELDKRLEAFGALNSKDLILRIVAATDREPSTTEQRQESLHDLLTRDMDMHGWTLAWSDRGLRLSHSEHQLVLGLSSVLRDFLSDPAGMW